MSLLVAPLPWFEGPFPCALQIIHELKSFLLVGRVLVHSDMSLDVSLVQTLESRLGGSVVQLRVDLLFPVLPRTVTRLMEAWWRECKGGKPATRQEQMAASRTGKASHRAMPMRFPVMLAALLYWERELTNTVLELGWVSKPYTLVVLGVP